MHAGAGLTHGGSLSFSSGGSESGESAGDVMLTTARDLSLHGAQPDTSLSLDQKGSIQLTTTNGQTVSIDSGDHINVEVPSDREVLFKHSDAEGDEVTLRLRKDKIISHRPVQVPEVTSPSDERIKQDLEDVDTDALLQRLQGIEIKSYRYTEAWRAVRGIEDVRVRGVIAQQLREVFPEYVNITPDLNYPDKDFSLDNFHEVNKIRLAVDTLGALQAQHKRITVMEKTSAATSAIDVNTASGTESLPNTGSLKLRTGSSSQGNSGSLQLTSGSAAGQAGSIFVGPGTAGGIAGGVSVSAGDAAGQGAGGSLLLESGAGEAQGGSVRLETPSIDQGSSGDVTLVTGQSALSSGSVVLKTGSSADSAGGILLEAGLSGTGEAGSLSMHAGSTDSAELPGGQATLSGGRGASLGGSVTVQSAAMMAGTGRSGDVAVNSGASSEGSAGSVSVNSGDGDQGGLCWLRRVAQQVHQGKAAPRCKSRLETLRWSGATCDSKQG